MNNLKSGNNYEENEGSREIENSEQKEYFWQGI